jgi:uncharacterized Zn finger protein
MVRARLHIICGNCGSNDQFEHSVKTEPDDDSEKEGATRPVVYLTCANCNTLHDLEDYSTLKK